MLVKTSPVNVLFRGPYGSLDDADPVVWSEHYGEHAGQLIEKVIVMDGEDGTIFDNLTLDPTCDLQPGGTVLLTVQIKRESKPAYARGGREYVAIKDKWRVVGFELAPAPAPVKAERAQAAA